MIAAFAQESKHQIDVVINKSGWKIPGLSTNPSASTTKKPDAKGSELEVQKLKPSSEIQLLTLIYAHGDNAVTYPVQPIKVQELWSYKAKGHVFAYRIKAEWVGQEPGRVVSLASTSIVFFYDSTGNGKFDTMRYVNGNLSYNIEVPSWLNNR